LIIQQVKVVQVNTHQCHRDKDGDKNVRHGCAAKPCYANWLERAELGQVLDDANCDPGRNPTDWMNGVSGFDKKNKCVKWSTRPEQTAGTTTRTAGATRPMRILIRQA